MKPTIDIEIPAPACCLTIVRFATLFEDEFVKLVMDEHYKHVQIQQRRNQLALQEAMAREKEVDVLYEKLFEEKILGNLTEDRFKSFPTNMRTNRSS